MSKIMIALIALSFASTSAFAGGITFLPGTALPTGLQEKIELAYGQQCPKAQWASEVVTTAVSQANGDISYETTLSTSWYFDGMHPIGTTITIQSADLVSTGQRFVVKSVEADSDACGVR